MNRGLKPLYQKMRELILEAEKIEEKIKKKREACKHEHLVGEYDSDSGNYCPQDDRYWVSAICMDCGKEFTVYSDKDESLNYREISMRMKQDKEELQVQRNKHREYIV